MVKAVDVKTQRPNQPGQTLLMFWNSVINLQHVAEIDSITEEKYAIVFRFADGRERVFTYGSQSEHSLGVQTLHYCLENNLMSVELTEDCYMKWAGYRREEADRAYRYNK
ncbi:hypothetical protein GCM10009504_08010 [Pseudomonas laurentiana]|uniref:Uncharacterized protein n=1 Tax=Pseudomonas laurentiana TaxID=2364649 RepID=A0A6I5RT68_9PSED|nr:hypothetical protein [Pseudomonas laurentiana]NES11362.1 hypothetical protein [Pseudomonas laurentiana]GGU53632.1 hypothetical protein GCM10009504_08010 [Pseudomonas laurentiana]